MTAAQSRRSPERGQAQLPVDPRILARLTSVRQARFRRRRRSAIAAATATTLAFGAWILARSSVLSVQHLVVRGSVHTRRAVVLSAAGLDRRMPMIDVDAGRIQGRLETLPWVAAATVARSWPATVTIELTERNPVAEMAGTAGQVAVVDAAGRVLAVGAAASEVIRAAQPPLPMLIGVPRAGSPGTSLGVAAYGVLRVAQGLRSASALRRLDGAALSAIAVGLGPDGGVSASFLPGPVNAIFGTTNDLDAKLEALRLVVAQVGLSTTATIDVRVVDFPVLTDGKNSSSVSTTQRG